MAKIETSPQTKAHEEYLAGRRQSHTKELLGKMGNLTATGIRLVERRRPENGVIVTFDDGEADVIVEAVRKVLQRRKI